MQKSTGHTLGDRIFQFPIFMCHGRFLDTENRLLNIPGFKKRLSKRQALSQILITKSVPTTKVTFITYKLEFYILTVFPKLVSTFRKH